VEVGVVSRFSRRQLLGGATLTIAVVLTIGAATSATASASRAANRWNHVVTAPVSSLNAAGDMGTEPQVSVPVWKTLRLFEQFGQRYTFVDVAPKGDSPGDYGVFKDAVVTKGGMHVGTIDAQCIAAYSDQCSGSIRIPGRGQITFAGITPLGVDPDHYAVTGGTGEFAGVGGVLLIEFPFIDAAKLTITLTR
jgi:allene oxide cyclase-like protein